jgi:hypothetical protein
MGQAIRRKELFYRKVGKLHHLRTPIIDDRDETRACDEYGLVLIRPPPAQIQPRDPIPPRRVEINSKHLRKLFNP